MAYKPSTNTSTDNDFKLATSEALFEGLKLKVDAPASSGTANQILSLLNPTTGETAWVDNTGGGVTSVSATSPVASSGGTTPVISLSAGYGDTLNPYASKIASRFLASPSGSSGVPTFRGIVAADIPTLNQNTTGTASNVTGIVAIANGGTGQSTANAALNALLPSQSSQSGKYLTTDGTNTSWSTVTAGVSSVSGVSPISSSGGSTPAISISQANSTTNGFLSSTDWTTFNNKQAAITGGATTITSSNLTASRALVSDASGKVAVSAVTSTQLGYVSGVTSAIQTQLNAKQATITGAATTVTSSNLTASRAVVSDSSGKLAAASVTATELGYLSGVSSSIQDQINNKASQGLQNYISNFGAETDTSGWATYADAAGSAPVDGTGGTAQANLWIRSTTSPLRGTGSFRLDKTGSANRQGQGASFAFTIDRADLAKVLTVTFDYEVVSGTYADGDVTVYLYDVTNSQVIQPAGFQVQKVASGVENKHIATFQTASNSTSYRLIFHIASTSTQNYTLAIDNVSVGPQSVQYGAPVTDWQSFTPVGSFTTNSTYSGYYRRVGDTLEIKGKIAFSGAPNSTNPTLNIPFGLQIDSSKFLNETPNVTLGLISILDAGNNGYTGFVRYNSSGSVLFTTGVANSTYLINNNMTQAVPFTIGSGDAIYFEFAVPIVGWSSTVQMSNDTDTRVVAANASKNATQNVTAGVDVIAQVTLQVYSLDTHGGFSGSNYTVPVPGIYRVSGQVNVQALSAGNYASCTIRKNGVTAIASSFFYASTTELVVPTSNVVSLSAGDTISLWVAANDSNYNVMSGVNASYLTIERLSGPSAIAASETVSARYSRTTSSLSSSYSTVTFNTKDHDTHGAYSGGTYTVPVNGKYQISSSVSMFGTASPNPEEYVAIFKNGVQVSTALFYVLGSGSGLGTVTVSDILSLVAGDQITIRCKTTLVSPQFRSTENNSWNFFNIAKIGN